MARPHTRWRLTGRWAPGALGGPAAHLRNQPRPMRPQPDGPAEWCFHAKAQLHGLEARMTAKSDRYAHPWIEPGQARRPTRAASSRLSR